MNVEEIKVKFVFGADIKDAVFEMYQLAIKHKAKITTNFNGLIVSVQPEARKAEE